MNPYIYRIYIYIKKKMYFGKLEEILNLKYDEISRMRNKAAKSKE